MDYQKHECDDSSDINRLAEALKDKKILMIGPGASIKEYRDRINKYIEDNAPLVISINYIPGDFHPDYMFITNTTRFLQSATRLHEKQNQNIKLIASSNLTQNERDFDYVINYSSVIDESAEFPDNSMCMLIRVLLKCGCGEAALAGFDGYTPYNVNYLDTDKAYSFLTGKAESLNAYAVRFFEDIKDSIKIRFITPSEYIK
ncbi:MAG TPA: hypothetical protein DIS78_08370 [Lachnospiraceae bacterium]|nr:hypothetical protein [Lachnospiraceae bacterium]